jgi:hypothetical protein
LIQSLIHSPTVSFSSIPPSTYLSNQHFDHYFVPSFTIPLYRI